MYIHSKFRPKAIRMFYRQRTNTGTGDKYEQFKFVIESDFGLIKSFDDGRCIHNDIYV